MVKLSIIIPYYETFDLTKRLLMNLAIQMKDNVEVILIDDYCHHEFSNMKYELALNNIHLIEHETNQGTAKTRNEGIRLARGEYIGFCDCDDQVTNDYIEILLDAIEKYHSEVINFNWLDLDENVVFRKPHNPAMWKSIYRKDIIPFFREDMRFGNEDVDFNDEVEKLETTYLDRVLYLYNSKRKGNLTSKKEEYFKEHPEER